MNSIEIFGLPAAGKSTFLKSNYLNYEKPLDKYIYSNSRITRNSKKAIMSIYFIIKKPFLMLKLLNKFIKLKFKYNKIKMFIYLITTLAVIEFEKSEEFILDEGICQVIWAISYLLVEENEVKWFFINLGDYISNKIIFLENDKNIIIYRLKNRRGEKGGSELSKDILLNEEESYKLAIERYIQIKTIIMESSNIYEIINKY